jgi:hypothetical protein
MTEPLEQLKPGASVLLAAEDAQVFIAFKRHREKFLTLLSAGVFELQSGRADIAVHNGQIQGVHIYQQTYKRGATM